ncbi:MAG: hypothetical protein HOM21_04220 [Halobacteriovoraceae bacterium]|nr:hypothetical protein [Halobacteriovoraceae bacterium]
MKRIPTLVHRIVLALIIVQLSACNFVKNKHIDRPFNKFVKGIETQVAENPTDTNKLLLKRAQKLEKQVDGSVDIINDIPHLDGQLSGNLETSIQFVKENGPKIKKYMSDIEKSLSKTVGMVQDLGASNYEVDPYKRRSILSTDEKAQNEALVLFSLAYIRNMAMKSMSVIFPFTIGTYEESYEASEEMMTFRKEIMELYLGINGMIVITQRDIEATTVKLKHYKSEGLLSKTTDKSIGRLFSKTLSHEKKLISNNKKMIEELDDEKREKFEEVKEQYMAKFEGKSFLFDPRNPDNIPLKILAWVGNLTWGAFNSLVGLGWVIGTAIVSPFTRYVDFPTIKLSRSGVQLYADVSNTTFFRGKVSLGIFELDQNAGWSFASYHEGGHALQSALLGPLYLPAVALSYMMNGGHGGFIESWATTWGNVVNK